MCSSICRKVLLSAIAGLLLFSPTFAQSAGNMSSEVARLELGVEHAEDIRAVKTLQRTFAQYMQFGLWDEIESLFSDEAELIDAGADVRGKVAIGHYFLQHDGAGHQGNLPGTVRNEMMLEPVVNLSADGNTAYARWHVVMMRGRLGEDAEWRGGIEENEYRKEDGVWKIARMNYSAIFEGPYATGWHSVKRPVPFLPYHYTTSNAGVPVPSLPSPIDSAPEKSSTEAARRLVELDARVSRLNDEDHVRNLQNIYGYYIDRKMWDDVTDLFTRNGMLEIANIGIYDGPKNIRRALEIAGPAGLRTGELNDHLQYDMVASVEPGGKRARAQGLELGMLGDVDKDKGFWTISVFKNDYVKGQDGKWRIAAMRIFPLLKSDYYQGWAKSQIVDHAQASAHAPDRPAPDADRMQGRGVPVPAFFYRNPVTGKTVRYPSGLRVVGELAPLGTAVDGVPPGPGLLNIDMRKAEVERKLAVSVGYDAVENISGAFANWMDDAQWTSCAEMYAKNGARLEVMVGFYIGPERIKNAELIFLGQPPTPPRTGEQLHIRMQPVIYISPDGRSAKLSTRLFHLSTSYNQAGSFSNGMYPDDTAVLEDGIWKFEDIDINEPYFSSTGWAGGWAKVPPPGQFPAGHITPERAEKLRNSYPPDIPVSAMGSREKDFLADAEQWPSIKPMWFFYKNPVSGRIPPYYCPDEGTCYAPPTPRK